MRPGRIVLLGLLVAVILGARGASARDESGRLQRAPALGTRAASVVHAFGQPASSSSFVAHGIHVTRLRYPKVGMTIDVAGTRPRVARVELVTGTLAIDRTRVG